MVQDVWRKEYRAVGDTSLSEFSPFSKYFINARRDSDEKSTGMIFFFLNVV